MSRKTRIIFTVINIMLTIMFSITIIYCMRLQYNMKITVYFGESHAGERNIAKLFYAPKAGEFSQNDVITEVFEDNEVSFNVGAVDFKENIVRLDPLNTKKDFSICRIAVVYDEFEVFTLEGDSIKDYIKNGKGLQYEVNEGGIICTATTSNPRLIMKRAFSDKLYFYYNLINRVPFCVMLLIFIVFGVVQIKVFTPEQEGDKVGSSLIPMVLADILTASGVILLYVISYFERHFGQVPFGQLVYHLHTPLEGTDISSYNDVIFLGVLLVVFTVIGLFMPYYLLKRKKAHRGYILWLGMLGAVLIVCAAVRGCMHFEIIDYYKYTHENTSLYEDYYVDGREVTLTFPKKKRNLIYIFLESIEITYADTASGGGMQTNYIPELTEIALNNYSFSGGDFLNGAYQMSGATYTMGALAAQTSGVPINEILVSNDTLNGTWESENNYLPGVWAIGDVLKKAGYNQEFLIGSNGKFAGRSSYFKGHGDYVIEDYGAAIEEGRIPSDYKVWWGYEDEKLFSFAKEDITKLAKEDAPFNFTMLTVDTHATEGYQCSLCKGDYELQYSNVIACSDRQVADFVKWIQEQDFYEDTTIVIAGDHLTPDSYYIMNEGVDGFDRKTYFTIVNPVADRAEAVRERIYTTLDLYPTTLSGLGVDIEGNRLGLGVDLFSDTPTLAEEKGLDYLNIELLKNSDYYTKNLLYK